MSLYGFCKYLTLFTSKFYYHKIVVSGMEHVPLNKPVLLALNHPNSFLDAVLVATYLNRPTNFLARGDVFKNKKAAFFLKAFHMLPVYRLSEGKENLHKNKETFDSCQAILEEKEVVLIFPEGLSENNWELRSFKKGPGRIAMKAWKSDTPANKLQILPIGLTYEHYRGGGKIILINIGKPILESDISEKDSEAVFVKQFNQKIHDALHKLAFINKEMAEGTSMHWSFRAHIQQLVGKYKNAPQIVKGLYEPGATQNVSNNNLIKQTLLFWPLYAFCNSLAKRMLKSGLFFDSVSFGLFIFLWPVYLVLVITILINLI